MRNQTWQKNEVEYNCCLTRGSTTEPVCKSAVGIITTDDVTLWSKLELTWQAQVYSIFIARTISWQDVCPSVCLSVRHTPVLSLNGYILKVFFYNRVAPPFQFSHTKRDGNNPTATLLTGASNARGYEKNHDFRPIFRFISELMHDRAHSYYGRRIGNRNQASEWYRFERYRHRYGFE